MRDGQNRREITGSVRESVAHPAVDAWMKMWTQLGYGIVVYNMLNKQLVDINASAFEICGKEVRVKELDVESFCEYCRKKALIPKEIGYEHYMAFVFFPEFSMRKQNADVDLSKRENEVMECIVLGKTADEMATILGISRRTVEKHCENICKKFGVKGRKELLNTCGMVTSGEI